MVVVAKDLALRQTGNGLARGSAVDVGPADDIEAVTFSTKGLLFTEMPTVFRKGAAASTALALRAPRASGVLEVARKTGRPKSSRATARVAAQVIASGARMVPGARKAGERVVQRQVGWQATPASIVITTAERPLRREDGKRFVPVGEWLIEDRKTYPCPTGLAEKREGEVPFDQADEAPPRPQQASVVEPPPEDPFPEGSTALSFLPRTVRMSMIARVPQPTVFDGTVLQFSKADGAAVRQEINVIRMDEQQAVVVQATREPNSRTWKVVQAVYALGAPSIEQV